MGLRQISCSLFNIKRWEATVFLLVWFGTICKIYFPSLREQFREVAYVTHPRPLVLPRQGHSLLQSPTARTSSRRSKRIQSFCTPSTTFLLCHTAQRDGKNPVSTMWAVGIRFFCSVISLEGDGKNPVSTVWMDSKFAWTAGIGWFLMRKRIENAYTQAGRIANSPERPGAFKFAYYNF